VDFCVAMRAYAIGNPHYPAAAVLSAILGGGPASRLFSHVREDRGLVYDIRTDVETFRDVGAITVSTYCGEPNLEPTLMAVFDALDDVRATGVTVEELDRARGLARASADYLLDSPFDMAEWFGRVETLDEPADLPDPRHEAERFAAIEMKDIEAVIADTLRPANRYLAVIGPVGARQRRRVETLFRQRTAS
jgi:predicted Zn-dependent peptidase